MEKPNVLNYNPVFSRFVEANEGLLDCYQAINMEDYKNMTPSQKNGCCMKEKNTIK